MLPHDCCLRVPCAVYRVSCIVYRFRVPFPCTVSVYRFRVPFPCTVSVYRLRYKLIELDWIVLDCIVLYCCRKDHALKQQEPRVPYCIGLVWYGLDRIWLYCCGGDDNGLIVPRLWLRLRCGCCVVMVVVVPEFMTVQYKYDRYSVRPRWWWRRL